VKCVRLNTYPLKDFFGVYRKKKAVPLYCAILTPIMPYVIATKIELTNQQGGLDPL
jgi:hypothetical protein